MRIDINASIKDAMILFEKNLQKQVYVCEEDETIVGAVSEGDIRRALLKNRSLSYPIKDLMNKNFRFINSFQPRSDAYVLMKNLKLHSIPVLDQCKRLLDVINIDNIFNAEKKENMVFIMAGGLGRRLMPLTQNTPKPMLHIGNRPILEVIIRRLIDQGFFNFTIAVNFLADQIVEYFQNGSELGVNINYVFEDKKLGTCGALSLADYTDDKPLVLTNGDLITDINYGELLDFYNFNKCDALMCVREEGFKIPFGVVKHNEYSFKSIDEKPIIKLNVNAGIYVINKSVIDLIPKNTAYDATDLFNRAYKEEYQTKVFKSESFWLDIGRTDQYREAINLFSQN